MTDTVRHLPDRRRFELSVDGDAAFATYRRSGDVLDILHTETPVRLQGRGIGSALVRGMLDLIRAEGLKMRPLCPFVRGYVDRHPEYRDLLG